MRKLNVEIVTGYQIVELTALEKQLNLTRSTQFPLIVRFSFHQNPNIDLSEQLRILWKEVSSRELTLWWEVNTYPLNIPYVSSITHFKRDHTVEEIHATT